MTKNLFHNDRIGGSLLAAFAFAAFALCGAGGASAQDIYETYTGFTVDTTPVLPSQEEHPILYVDADDIDELRARAPEQYDEPYGPTWFRLRSEALDFINDDPAEEDENDRPRMAKTLAFWWLMTEDSTALRGAIDALLLAYDGVPQTDQKPYDEIYRATWIQNYAAAYDWVFDQLTPEQNENIRTRLASEAQFLHENLADFGRPHNHVSKPAWGLGTVALAMSDHPNAADWLQNALEQMNRVTRYQFSEDGIYREGGHYWMYSAVNMIPFLWHYLNVSGVDLFPDYEPAFVWPVKIRMGRGHMPNIEDSYLKPAPTHMVASQYLDSATDLNPSTTLGNVLTWNWETTELFASSYTGATSDVTWDIDEFIFWDQTIDPIAPSRSPTIHMEGGQTVFRNSWEGGRDHRYLLFHGVAEGNNHGHPDLLSFVAEAYDAYLIADPGYGPDGFSDDMRSSWYTHAKAHNIVTVNGNVPMAAIPSNETPPTPYFIDSDFFGFAEKRLDGFLRNQDAAQRRAIGFVGQDYWVVADVLTADEEKTYRSYLHGRGRFSMNGHHATWETFDDKYGQAAKIDAYLLPADASFSIDKSYISLFKDGRLTSYVEAELVSENVAMLQVLMPRLPNDPPSAVADLSTDDVTAAKVLRRGATDIFLAQPAPSTQHVEDLTTDGTFAWSRSVGGEVIHLSVREATSIEVAGGIRVTTDGRAAVAIDFSDPNRWTLHASAPSTRDIRARIHHSNAADVTSIIVGDTEVGFDRGSDGEVIIDFTVVATAAQKDPTSLGESALALANYPNPFGASTWMAFELENAGAYRLEVFDLLGRRVEAWERTYATGGRFEVEWNGTDAGGRPVPSGIYIARLRHVESGASATRTIVRIH